MDEINKIQASSQVSKILSAPISKKEIFAGVGLFLFLGFSLSYMEIPYGLDWIHQSGTVRTFIFALNFILPATGYGIGWIKGFPRWSYPYVGVVFLTGLYFMNASTPGVSFFGYEIFGRELWGLHAWIPLGIATLVGLAISRSFRPFKKFFANGWEDWTLFTFAMFGWLPELISLSFDEVDNFYTFPFVFGLGLLIILAAYAYMCSLKTWQRVLALGIGIVIPVAVASIGSTLYWLENGWVDPAGVAKIAFYVVLVMFSPAFIGFLRYTGNQISIEWSS